MSFLILLFDIFVSFISLPYIQFHRAKGKHAGWVSGVTISSFNNSMLGGSLKWSSPKSYSFSWQARNAFQQEMNKVNHGNIGAFDNSHEFVLYIQVEDKEERF